MNCRTWDRNKWTGLGLEFLQLYDLKLSGSLPDGVSSLSSLAILLLRENSLSGSVPADWAKLTGLDHLQISSTTSSGSIPSEFRSLTELKTLVLSSSRLNMDLDLLDYWQKIQYVMASDSDQAGVIAPDLLLPDTLQYLMLQNCKLSGTLSSKLFESNLTTIDVSSNSGISGGASHHTHSSNRNVSDSVLLAGTLPMAVASSVALQAFLARCVKL